jgi:hypothetical protein
MAILATVATLVGRRGSEAASPSISRSQPAILGQELVELARRGDDATLQRAIARLLHRDGSD